jgi:hypothetical protein
VFNNSYKTWLGQNGGVVEGRRGLADYADAHGTRAAVCLSGASKVTVNRLRKQAREARDAGAAGAGFRGPGRPPVSADDEERIVDARRAHPDYGPKRLKRLSGIPNAEAVIWAILKKHSLMRRGHRVRYPDPACMVVAWERRIWIARMGLRIELHATTYAVGLLAKGGRTAVKPRPGLAFRRLEEAIRKTAFWRRRADLTTEARRHGGNPGNVTATATAFTAKYAKYAKDGTTTAKIG